MTVLQWLQISRPTKQVAFMHSQMDMAQRDILVQAFQEVRNESGALVHSVSPEYLIGNTKILGKSHNTHVQI